MKKTKRFLAAILAVALMLSLLPVPVSAAVDDTFVDSGIQYKVLTESGDTGTVAVIANSYTGSIIIPATVDNGDITYTVTVIGENAFYECSGLTSVSIPGSVTSIGAFAFFKCSGLESISIPDGVTSIGASAFDRCISLESVSIPDSVTSIGIYAFNNCSGLKSISIPDSTTSIDAGTFYGCSGLTGISIPATVTLIGYAAFSDCTDLESITFYGGTPPAFGSAVFNNIPAGLQILVPYGSASAYGAALSGKLPAGTVIEEQDAVISITEIPGVTAPVTGAVPVTTIAAEQYTGAVEWNPADETFVKGTVYTATITLFPNEGYTLLGVAANSFTVTGATTVSNPADSGIITAVFPAPEEEIFIVDGIRYIVLTESGDTGTVEVIANSYTGGIDLPATVIYGGITYTVTVIGDDAFSDCSDLESISIPGTVTVIGEKAFAYCSKLTSISIPGVISIGDEAFTHCESLESITIPSGVTAIGAGMFEDCTGLTSISILGNVTSIGNAAFANCESLASINIPASVTSIGDYAFYTCGFESISIPGTVTSIGDYTFFGCIGLESISIPATVTLIGDYAFSNCYSLKSINIPGNVVNIGEGAFSYSGFTSISFPTSVTAIGVSVLEGCTGLESVTFYRNTPPVFGSSVFNYIPAGLQILVPHGSLSAYAAALSGMLPEDAVIEELDAVISITAIPGVTAPVTGAAPATSITETEQYTGTVVWNPTDETFVKDTVYTATITLSPKEGYTLLGVAANSFTVTGATTVSNPADSGIITAVFPVTEAEIFDKDGIRYRVLTESGDTGTVEVIANSYTGSSITIPETVVNRDITYTVTAIGESAFAECSGLKSISIPGNVTSIGDDAFLDCSSLESINIPDGMTSIGEAAFSSCSSLESISIPDSVTVIGGGAFFECSSLESISIPDGVTSIGNSTFDGCSSLESISIPDSVTVIGEYVFRNCSSLESISVPGGVTVIGAGMFEECTGLKSISILGNVTSIGNAAFANCNSLASISIPSTVTSIGAYAFYGCSGLTSISIPSTATSIGAYAFYGCSGLTSVSIPGTVTSIEAYVFYGCSGLTSISIPDSVTFIGDYAFYNCTDLESITFYRNAPPVFGSFVLDNIPEGLQILVPHGSLSAYKFAFNGLPANTVIEEQDGVIDITVILGVAAPVTGAAPVTAITETEQYTGTVVWNPADEMFVKDTVYTATITLLPKEGYTLTGVAANSFTVIGAATISNPANSGTITAEYPATEAGIFINDGIRYKVLTRSGDTGTVEINANTYTGGINIPATVVNDGITYTVTAIGDHAFYDCSSLESISIPDSVTVIGEYVFRHCSSLESVYIPDSVTAIGKYAFADCSGLESIYIPETVTIIEESTFYGCSSLESVNIPGSVTAIGDGAFAYCDSLTSVSIPGSVTAIGDGAFAYCGSLTSVEIPSSMTSIGDGAFYDCDSLTSAYFNGDAPTVGIDIFDGTASGFKVYYFYAASGWSNPWNGYETVAVAMAVELQSATADGTANTVTSTKIDLTFDTGITGLTADNITITNGTGAVVKGALTGSGTSWSIALTSVTTQGNVSVAVAAPAGYNLTGSTKTVAVSKGLPPITYIVTFDSQSGSQVSSISNVSFGSAISAPAAPTRTGYTFGGWYKEASCINVWNFSIDTVTVNTILYAKWTINSSDSDGGGSSGDGSGSGSNTTTPTPERKPDQPVTAAASVTAKAGTKGTASASIPDKAITDAIAKAQADAKAQGNAAGGISVVLNVTMPQGATSLTATLSQTALQSLVSAGVSSLELNGAPVSLGLDLKALQEIQKQSTGKITISIAPATGLSKAAKALVGNRPVYNITVTYMDKNRKPQGVSSLGSGTATLSIPYAPGKDEAVGCLFGVYVDGKGNASRIGRSTYDANSRSILLGTNHFSVYGVGYTAPAIKFTDTESHWAKESIDYIVGRGLISGTSKTAFSPDTAMTRGILATALGRLAGVDVKLYTTNSFTDVKADSPFRPYIEWAYKEGIIQGIGSSRFAPNRIITREEIAVILANYAKATGYTLPVLREAVTYADNSSIGSVYQTAVRVMQQAGIMMGGTGNKFNPRSGVTRAEVSSMLYRYIKLTIDPSTAQGWALNDAGQYFYYKDGKALTGWQTVDSTKYFFNADGTLKTGWVQDEADWRYYSGNKALVGWWDIGSGESKKTYYFTKDGLMVSGKWLQIDGKWYYFNADGSLARSTKIDGYEVDEKGVRKTK